MKPANIITNPKTKLLKLIDWGLSSFYMPGVPLSPRVGTRTYKAPELLLGYKYYDYEIDIFSIGLMFSKMVILLLLILTRFLRTNVHSIRLKLGQVLLNWNIWKDQLKYWALNNTNSMQENWD